MSEHDEKCEHQLWDGPPCECRCAYRSLETAYAGQALTIQEQAQRIAELEARLAGIKKQASQPWDVEWDRGYMCGWNECRKAALGGDDE